MTYHRRRRGARGITLLELLITVSIIAVLALIAYPSYQNHVGRVWRMKAVSCLEELAQGMERRFNGAMSYVGTAPPPNGCVVNGDPDWQVPEAQLGARYQFGFAAEPTTTAFTLQAIPIGPQISDDDNRCGTLSLNETGVRSASANPDPAKCW